MGILTWVVAADDLSRFGIGGGVFTIASAVVYLAWRLLRANDQQVERQLAPAWVEITELRKRIARLERDRQILIWRMQRSGIEVPKEVLDD